MRRLTEYAVRFALPVLILGGGITAFYFLSQKPEDTEESEPSERTIRTRVTELEVRDYPVVVTTQGIVLAHNEITLSAQVSGQIRRISPRFEVGSHVSAGDVLVEIDARDYENDVVIAKSQVARAKSDLEIAEAEFSSYMELFRRKFTTESELNRYTATREQAVATLDSAVAELEQAQLDLERTTIRAPFNGRIRNKNVGVGQSIGSGAALGIIFAVDYAEVRLPIAAREREYLRLPETDGAPGIPVTLRDAIHPDPNTTWGAEIVRTEGSLDPDSLELVAIARIDDPFGLETGLPPLRIGQPVTGRIHGEVLRNVVAIPRSAVRELDQIILVSKSDLRLTKVTVEPVWSDEDYVVARYSNIYEDMLLATTHIVYAPEGAQVEIIPEIVESSPALAALEDVET